MTTKTESVQEAVVTDEILAHFETHFPGVVQPTDRKDHIGYVIERDQLTDVARHIRDEMGYDYLSMVTSADYATEGYYEVVYAAYSLQRGGEPLIFKARADAAKPVMPSLVSVWPGAELQEREVYDMMGVRFEGHPDLRRILLWEGFDGFPLRKDWQEPYYEQDTKPFKSRWPGGKAWRMRLR